jgi:predicted ATP-grasp superfamily ATP-dependent carboligase
MRVLLSEGSGLTSRQVATQLGDAGHEVHVLSSEPFCLTRFTRRVRRIWAAPPHGDDPLGWLEAALGAYEKSGAEVLFPTQEQVAVLSACRERLVASQVRTAVPSFEALRSLQDKVSAFATLQRLGLPQPDGAALSSLAEAEHWSRFPVYRKEPIGTATSGVRLVHDTAELVGDVARKGEAATFGQGGILVQVPVEGRLAMVQGVFSEGALVAFHANLRLREATNGGASHKCSIDLPDVRRHVGELGRDLAWCGALSADVILSAAGPMFIDMNPRLVEPGNASRAGVDLVRAMLDVALDRRSNTQAAGRSGVATHQLLLGILGAAARTGHRRAVMRELSDAARQRGDYRGSAEELTPVRGDWRAAVPVVVASAAVLARPSLGRVFARGAVSTYALTPTGWQQLLDDDADLRGTGRG